MADRTFLDPLNDADELIREVARDLLNVSSALYVTGNDKLGKALGHMADDLRVAQQSIGEGRDMALNVQVSGAEAATANMMNAALGTARTIKSLEQAVEMAKSKS